MRLKKVSENEKKTMVVKRNLSANLPKNVRRKRKLKMGQGELLM